MSRLQSVYCFFFALYRFEGFAGIWSKLLAAAMPIIMGLVLAYLMNPVMLWLERCFKKLLSKKMKSESKLRKVSRALAITGSVIILVAIISLLIAAIVPSVIASISGLMKTLPNDVAAFINMIKNGNFGDAKLLSSRAQVYRMQPTTLRIMPQKS